MIILPTNPIREISAANIHNMAQIIPNIFIYYYHLEMIKFIFYCLDYITSKHNCQAF